MMFIYTVLLCSLFHLDMIRDILMRNQPPVFCKDKMIGDMTCDMNHTWVLILYQQDSLLLSTTCTIVLQSSFPLSLFSP